MDKIAFWFGSQCIYWSSIIITLSALTAACFFLALYIRKDTAYGAGFLAVPVAMVLSTVLSRLVHWYCRADSYESFPAAMTDLASGGYALLGVFAGCFLTAALLRLVKLHRNLPRMLDCMSVAGAAGIAVGRLACFFNANDRGQVMSKLKFLPFAYPVTNTVSGAVEYRLATFLFQAAVALGIFLWLYRYYGKTRRDGDTTLRFLLVYGCSQVVLDSTRYDKLFFRSNGFVSMVQVFGALGMALAIIVYADRMVKKRGFKAWYLLIWFGLLACIGCAGFMEYYVQRHGSLALFSYSVMSLCLVGVIALTLTMAHLSEKRGKK